MPTYEYECQKCGHRFETFQSMKDKPLTECPKCGGKVKRLIGTGAGILFKGSGFYQTDYRSESYRKRAKEDSGASKPAKEGAGEGKPGTPKPAGDSPKSKPPAPGKDDA